MYSLTEHTELLSFQYKILHFIVISNEQLHRWGLVDSDVCVWCQEQIETLVHIFLECEVVKAFWRDLKQWIHSKIGILYHVTNKEIVIGIQTSDLNVVNRIYMFAKWFTFIKKCNMQFLSLDPFIVYFSNILSIENELAKTRNKMEEFTTA